MFHAETPRTPRGTLLPAFLRRVNDDTRGDVDVVTYSVGLNPEMQTAPLRFGYGRQGRRNTIKTYLPGTNATWIPTEPRPLLCPPSPRHTTTLANRRRSHGRVGRFRVFGALRGEFSTFEPLLRCGARGCFNPSGVVSASHVNPGCASRPRASRWNPSGIGGSSRRVFIGIDSDPEQDPLGEMPGRHSEE